MFFLQDNDKYDNLVDRILGIDYFIHQFTFVFYSSQLAHTFPTLSVLASAVIIATFIVIILIDFYYFLRGKFNYKEIIFYFIISCIFLISFFHYRVVMVFANLFVISCFKNVNIKKYFRIYVCATACGMILNFILSFFGYTINYKTIRYGRERIRHGLGFYTFTLISHYYYSLVVAYIILKEKLKNIEYIVIILIDVALFIANDTKAVFIYTILVIFLEYIFNRHYNDICYKIFGILTSISYVLFAAVSYFLSVYYNASNSIMRIINKVLTGRLRLMHDGLNRWGFRVFGQTIPNIKDPSNAIDSSMVSMLMLNGLAVYIICIVFMTIFSYLAYKRKNIPILIALFAIALRSAFDYGFMALQFAPVVYAFYDVLIEKKNSMKI